MAIISRASLPEEFFDLTSAALLVQPEPQYLGATIFKMALGSAMSVENPTLGLPIGGRPVESSGAQYTSAMYDRLMLATPDGNWSQAFKIVPELNAPKGIGHTVRLNRPKFGGGGFTLAAREVASGTSISTTAIDLSSEQVTLTLKRYAGPYDATNSNVAPYAVDRLDATRAVHQVASLVGKHMQRDFDKWLDTVVMTLMSSGSTTLFPGAFSSVNDPTAVGDMPAEVDLLFRAEETLKNASIPRFPNGRYLGMVTPTFARQLKSDPLFTTYAKYFPEKNPLYQSYLATVGGIDVFESTTLTSANNTSSVPVSTSLVMGPEMLGAGVSRMPQVEANTQDNYGEQCLIIWLMYAAFGVLDNRFALQLKTA